MIKATSLLKRCRKRYLIVGSFALQQYGFDVDPQDIDIWLDPNIPKDKWKEEVRHFAGDCEVEDMSRWLEKRFFVHMRIKSDPHIDVLSFVWNYWPDDFDSVFRQAPVSQHGSLLPVKTVFATKRAGNREKDLKTLTSVLSELLKVCNPR